MNTMQTLHSERRPVFIPWRNLRFSRCSNNSSCFTIPAQRSSLHRRSCRDLAGLCRAADGEQAAPGVAFESKALPTQLNTIPHSREIRKFFYDDVTEAVRKALSDNVKRMSIRCTIPETNTDYDVYRVGTLLEMVRDIVFMLTADGSKVKVCVQQALGQGVFQGTPMSLNGVSRIMKQMDWGPAEPFLSTGNIGAAEVEGADAFILIAPQNIVGYSIVPYLSEMVEAAEAAGKPMIILNPKLGDIPSSGGVMGIMGRQGRQDFANTFQPAYHFRLLYITASMYPIMGALRYSYGGQWEVYERVELGQRQEDYKLIGTFDQEPKPPQMTQCFRDSGY